jgi:hypothetical protein
MSQGGAIVLQRDRRELERARRYEASRRAKKEESITPSAVLGTSEDASDDDDDGRDPADFPSASGGSSSATGATPFGMDRDPYDWDENSDSDIEDVVPFVRARVAK